MYECPINIFNGQVNPFQTVGLLSFHLLGYIYILSRDQDERLRDVTAWIQQRKKERKK